MRTTILTLLLALCLCTCALAAPTAETVEETVTAIAAEHGLTDEQFALSWRCGAEAYDRNGAAPMPVADVYVLPLNLNLYALQSEGADAAPAQADLQQQSLTAHDPAASQALIAQLGTFRDYKAALLARFAPELTPEDAYYTNNHFPTSLLAAAMRSLMEAPAHYGPALEQLQAADTPLQQALPEWTMTVCYSCDAEATAAAVAVNGDTPFVLAVSLVGVDNADAILAQLVQAIADCEEAPEPPATPEAEPQMPASEPVEAPAPEAAAKLPWYLWAGIGLAAILLVLLALELRAAHQRNLRRRARQKNREAYLRAREQENED